MRIATAAFCLALAAPAAAQTHARHTAGHDSAHAIMLDDAQHLALHQLLLGHWIGAAERHASHDTLHVRFENDSSHQMLMLRQGDRMEGFVIRGDTLRWQQDVSGASCTATTPVSALLQLATAKAAKPEIKGTLTCGSASSPLTLRKSGT